MSITLIIFCGLVLLWFGASNGSTARGRAPGTKAFGGVEGRPLRISHRGCGARYPENTLYAFAAALHDGAEVIELDVHLSADGVPVVIHDPTLENAQQMALAAVREQTAGALAALRAAPAGGGVEEGVPTLEAVFEKFPETRLLVEVKTVESVRAAPDPYRPLRAARSHPYRLPSPGHCPQTCPQDWMPPWPPAPRAGEVGLFYRPRCRDWITSFRPEFNAFSLPPRSGIIPLTIAPLPPRRPRPWASAPVLDDQRHAHSAPACRPLARMGS